MVVCPGYGAATENIDHIFRECLVRREVWVSSNLAWTDRNKGLHEGKKSTSLEIAAWINIYIKELEGCKVRDFTTRHESISWCPPVGSIFKLNFDAAFDDSRAKSVLVEVARNSSREVIAFKTVAYGEVASSFAVEALACLQAVFMGKQMGFTSVIIEGNSVSVIKK
ncbi:hypothetical protein GOBAR_DD07597 [Gossypium barbadense]|nr:hypothetical protein GOBAR_DD07597 [Gossypium barbadense]